MEHDQSPDHRPATEPFQRLRLRFHKEGNLRWISHRDLVRTIERLLRRAGVRLRMSAGFHPKPKMSFPSALALGIAGQAEVMELEVIEPVEPAALAARLNAMAPAGLHITHIDRREPGAPKARLGLLHYQFPIPPEYQPQADQAVARLRRATTVPVERPGRREPIELLDALASLALRDDRLCFALRTSGQATARPRDVLEALGLTPLEQQGCFLTRTEVEVIS